MKPNAKHRLFAKYLADGLSQTEAYVKAGFRDKNPSSGAALLLKRNSSIFKWRDEMAAPAQLALEETTSIDLQRILFENARIAFSDIGQLYDGEGNPIPVHKLPADVRRSIASIEVVQLFGEGKDGKGVIGHTKKIRFWNKGEALDRLMKHFGGYEKDNKQKVDTLANVPREVLKLIEQRLLDLARPALPRRRRKVA